jgi:hypothetical protein
LVKGPGAIVVSGGVKRKDVKDFSETFTYEVGVGWVVSKEKRVGNVFTEANVPDNFFAGVVEWKTDFTVLVSNGVGTRGLELFNEVFVSVGCETFTFFGVEEYVVNE